MSLETARTEYLNVDDVRFAFRRLGPTAGTPLILLQHFTGTMDAWDPAVADGLAATRPVIAFNNLGIGTSTGRTPDTVEQMAADAGTFIRGLGLSKVDLVGFSLGGMLAQVLAMQHPSLIRKIVIAGAAPRGGEEHLLAVVEDAFAQGAPDVRLPLFFTPSEKSQRAGQAFVARATARTQDRDPDSGDDVSVPQAKAIIGWCAVKDEGDTTLRAIAQPALIVHGSDDTMFPSINAYNMFKAMKNAQFVLYPDSGHGAVFQYPETFVAHCHTFLDA
ncbi:MULTISPECIES: alpha/beta fold hydrolase [Rhizobium]|uniref:Alpha/beta hydrolase n=1 Tax=Rhizobium tropici TaxID=398 RepID=A0A6P1C8J1_RHITR|nr:MULTISPECIES: alpha/beta hydrolase [Rhizobium]AGB75523.1 alpha/beta hydrolase fold protein [Rhizobium tropici CIAT 899]MBB4241896.1 pimeloyl-ACP methyl ester carboxylesterase [Rhizobium tropici]MBB5593457.1 pimeloyl-ACP methyl ester carboxylesterase [Rhizobium tropici]MBB6492221.1 pimeloyl-ACP methyl ester carboxylesterase [Rhizobium tropici]NEV13500.1 alpha/beta hydrolase [Rhizobium tropici]